jgi:hypothetical protein
VDLSVKAAGRGMVEVILGDMQSMEVTKFIIVNEELNNDRTP